MRAVNSCLLASLLSANAIYTAAETGQANCADRLDRTLIAIQERPLLKEEHATALMWLRMDATEADAAGDETGCLEMVAVAETLLGLRPEEDH